jgi:GAF domain-containing protein
VSEPDPGEGPAGLAGVAHLNRLLNVILETAVEVLGFDAATLSARSPEGALSTVAATDQALVPADEAQYAAGDGPCLRTMDKPEPVILSDFASLDEERWRSFLETAQELGIQSSLSMHVDLGDTEKLAASLNLYGRRSREIGADQVRQASIFASQLATAMKSVEAYEAAAHLAANLAEAMRTRAVIEQAKGMLMAERQIDADEAFALLATLSQHANTKLRDVALRLVEDRGGGSTEPH